MLPVMLRTAGYQGTGIVKEIDMNSKKITISHEAIPVGWPGMTMRFTFVNADDAINARKPATMSISRSFSRADILTQKH